MPTFISQLNWPRPFFALGTLALVLWLLHWLAPLVVPIALAILLAFLLTPVVVVLERWGLNRSAAVSLVVLFGVVMFLSGGLMVGRQVASIAPALPQYERNLSSKLASLSEGALDRFQFIAKRMRSASTPRAPASETSRNAHEGEPMPVRVIPEPAQIDISDVAKSLMLGIEPLARVAFVAMLVIFMLVRREDLRERLIGLVGQGRVTLTTKALGEAGARIAAYLLTQLGVNAAYGATLGLGLAVLGVPYALLWGILAGVLRYVPYVGAFAGALLPILFSALTMQGWHAPIFAACWYLLFETAASLFLEPWIYGKRIGISPAAALVMVGFWTWLWGPVGLILAFPLSVCLVVVGQYVPHLKFFDTLLGDKPVFEPHSRFYQRLLAHDEAGALRMAERSLLESSLLDTYDRLVLPALISASRAASRRALNEEEHKALVHTCTGIVDALASLADSSAATTSDAAGGESPNGAASPPVVVAGFAAHEETDELILTMLKTTLDAARNDFRAFGSSLLAGEAVDVVEREAPALACIAAAGAGGLSPSTNLCRRLRRRFPQLHVVVGRCDADEDAEESKHLLLAAGASDVASSIAELRSHVVAVRAPSLEEQPG